jgi:hypothetical protein
MVKDIITNERQEPKIQEILDLFGINYKKKNSYTITNIYLNTM